MSISATVYGESYAFAPTALLSLYTLDTRFISANGSIYRFHAGVNGVYKPIVWNDVEYTPFPIEMKDMEINGNTVVRPKVRVSNINGFMSQFLLTQQGLVGARFVRTRVFARFLPHVNFPNQTNPYGTPDPTAAYDDEIFFVNRLVSENPDMVEVEICTPFELDDVKLPHRPLNATICSFTYRDPETCGYSGDPVSDRFGKSFTASVPDGYGYTLSAQGAWSAGATYQVGHWVTVVSENDFTYGQTFVYVCSKANTTGASNNPQFNPTNWVQDACPKNLLGCKMHFPTGPLPFGGAPGTARSPYA